MADPTGADITRVRRLATGDVTSTVLSSDDITDVWVNEGRASALLTAAECCDLLAVRAGAVNFRWTADGQSMDKTMQPTELRARAIELRRRYHGGSGHIAVTLPYTVAAGSEFA